MQLRNLAWRVLLATGLALALVPATALAPPRSTAGRARGRGPTSSTRPRRRAPQLTNTGVWKAQPILVSGSAAYRGGEYLYQDYLYDDHGANQAPDPADPRTTGDTFSKPNGTYSYPTDSAYAHNAADFVELRVKPVSDATAFRVTLNTLKDPSLFAFSIAIGGTPGTTHPFPAGANVSAPADLFLTVHPGAGPAWSPSSPTRRPGRRSAPRRPSRSTPPAARSRSASRTRPGTRATSVVRLAAGIGLWDNANDRYLLPQPTAGAATPRRLGRGHQPGRVLQRRVPLQRADARGRRPAGTAAEPGLVARRGPGRRARVERHQRPARERRLPQARRQDQRRERRPEDRADRPHPREPLRDPAGRRLLRRRASPATPAPAPAAYQGNLQPYAIYVPNKPVPSQGYGMTLLLHSLGATYNQYLDSRNQSQFGERGQGSIVITPLARGPDGGYDQLRRGRRVRGVGRRRAPLQARPRVDRDHRLLDGRLRHVQARGAVPRPVRARAADRRREQRHQHARLAAQHPGADVERARRRAGAAHVVPADRAGARPARLPLRARRVRRRAPDARDPRPVRARRRVPRHGGGGPQPGARHLRGRRRASTTPTSGSSPTTPTGSRARARAPPARASWTRSRTRSAPATRPPPRRSSAPARSATATSARSRSRASTRRGDRRCRARRPTGSTSRRPTSPRSRSTRSARG